jgi:hypothetical protein
MNRDEIVASALVLSFAAFATAHLVLVARLAGQRPRWRALAALVVPPLAPYWGVRLRRHAHTGIWTLTAVTYLVLRWLAGS